MEEKAKKLRLMRYWLFGAYLIVVIGFTVYFMLLVVQPGMGAVFSSTSYWLWVLGSAILFVVGYFLYKWYLGRKT
jgi:hypothetical protein